MGRKLASDGGRTAGGKATGGKTAGIKAAGRKTVAGENGSDKTFLNLVREQAVEIYLIVMLGFYPVYMVNGYSDLVFKKWALLKYASVIFLILCLAFWLLDFIIYKKGKRIQLSAPDWFVMGYFLCVLISYAGAIDKQAAWWGVDTWYTGFVFQLILVGIYFGISRGYSRLHYLKYLAAVIGTVVSAIVILQRLGVDVFHLYQGYGEDVRLNFVTTLGQVTWTSGYLSILLAAGLGIYYLTEIRKNKIFWGCCIGIGFAMEAVLNCDSGVISILCALMILLWISIGKKERMLRFIEIILIALASVGIIGVLERIFAAEMAAIDAVYIKTAQSMLIVLLLVIVSVFYYLVSREKIRISGKQQTVRIIRGIYLGIICAGIAGVAVLFVLHGKGYFAGSPSENYFRFTVWWGNSRGFIWRTGAAVFGDFNIFRKLFGCGPDCFTPYAYRLMGDAINEFWHNQLVPNVHNEWFQSVINYGIIGGIAYLGIFVSSAWSCLMHAEKAEGNRKQRMENGVILGIGLASAAYIVHNILCYQQIIGTPVMFILLGLGAAGIKSSSQ